MFGPNTEKEVKKFQQENGLTPDGIVGPRTMELFHPTTDLQESNAWIEPYLLMQDEYCAGPTSKEYIFIHHTAGWNNPYKCIDQWDRDTRGRIATQYVIGGPHPKTSDSKYDGVVLEAFDSNYWAYHLGKNGSSHMHSHSVGIEVCNFGPLTKDVDKYYTWANTDVHPDNVCDLGFKFRGFQFWHDYSEAQIDALKNVILYVKEKHNIDVTKGLVEEINKKEAAIAFDYNEEAYYGKRHGMWNHTNTRKDKSDMYPYPKLVEMLKNL